MDINKLTIGEAKEIVRVLNMGTPSVEIATVEQKPQTFFKVGEQYFIRTVTMYYTGNLIAQNENELLLSNCAWIADTGRFTEALKTGEFSEVELFPADAEVGICKGAILDFHVWKHELPNAQK